MNFGASFATQKLMYFLHADTIPQKGFTSDIDKAIAKGYNAGCFMLFFDYNHWFLKANCWFSRFDVDAIRFGDQSSFVSSDIFKNSGVFAKMHILLEDQELIKRLKKMTRFKIIKMALLTSARKYL